MMDRAGHTPLDFAALTDAGIDPASTPPREHRVSCTECRYPTGNISARCDRHYLAPPKVRKVAA